ncbi:outer membrane protein [Pararhodobacter oceanensis]|nr:porin family protein [Pararhodobacter oceanensis]
MKKLVLSAVLAATSTAAMASGPIEYTPPAVVPVIPSAYDWNGAYVGVGLAYTRAQTSSTSGNALPDATGGSLGVLAGYNWQNNNTVMGVEAALSFSNLSATSTCGGVCAVNVENFAAVRGRLGYAVDRTMFFMTAGYATDARSFTDNGVNGSARFNGPTIGVGVEHAMNNDWSVRGDLEHYFFGSETVGANTYSASTSLLRVGVVRRF